MTSPIDKYAAMGAKAVAEGKDMTKAQAGGGEYEPPAAGNCWLRLAAYIELGKQAGTFKGAPTIKDKVLMVFEVSGPKHPPTKTESGELVPIRISVEETLSLNEKAHFFKLFQRMNYAGQAQHMVQLLGQAYKGRIVHRKYKKRGETDANASGIAVELFDKAIGTYTIEPPRYDVVDDEGNVVETKVKAVDALISKPKAFLWEYSDLDDWSNLFIDGEYPERKNDKGEVIAPAKSKNVLQNRIKQAANFKGSPIYTLLAAVGGNLDVPDAEVPDAEEAEDTLAGKSSAAAGKGTGQNSTGSAQAAEAATPTPVGAAADDALNGVL